MSKSKKHHYIPQFFIRNFTDNDGLLYVYNKDKDQIVKYKQSPKGLFFENDRNTVDFSGHQLDNLESMYSALDSTIAKDYLNVLKTETVTPEELISITLLANMLRWRVPKSDTRFNEIKTDLSQEQLNIKITVKDKGLQIDPKALEHIEGSDIFIEGKRILLSILPLLNQQKVLEIHNSSFININSLFPSLIGDSHVVFEDESDFNAISNFILPLSSEKTFIYKQDSKGEVNNILFFFHRDLSIIHHSQKYVGCRSLNHLEKIVTMYRQVKAEGRLEDVEKFAFNFIK